MWNVETVDSKKDLRNNFRQLRDAIMPEVKWAAEQRIQQGLEKLLSELAVKSPVVAYRGHRSEVNLDQFIKTTGQYKFAFPRVSGELLEFYEVLGFDQFETGSFGVLEPDLKKSKRIDLMECGAVLVPGMVFDRMGRRLGSGKGFYDRALANFKGLKIGIAFKAQVTKFELPHEDHDIFMDYIITEDFTLLPVYQKRN